MNKLSVVIPAYNEAERIGKTLEAVGDILSKQAFDYEILVINDGSKDNTAEVVRSFDRKVKNLKLVDNKHNQGKGGAVKDGMVAASGDVRLFMDADNSTTVDQVLPWIKYFDEGYDIVAGSRRIEGANIAVHQGWFRDFLGGVFRFIVHTLVPVGVTDTQCGFKAFSAEAARAIFPKQTIFRWAFDVEIFAIARRMKFKIKEAPVTWIDDSKSHVKFSGMVKMLLEVLQVRINLWTGKYKV